MDDVSFAGWQPEKSIHVVAAEGTTRVFMKGRAYMSWRSGDEECLRLAMVQLHQCGLATEEELAAIFGPHVNSVRRYLAGFAEHGARGLLLGRTCRKTEMLNIPNNQLPQIPGIVLRANSARMILASCGPSR